MFLLPNNPKYTKIFVGKKRFVYKRNNILKPVFGNFCLIAANSGIITNFQLETLRRFLKKNLKKKSQQKIRVFPTLPITKKPNEIRLGRGKGNVAYWAYYLKKGSVIIELRGLNYKTAKNVLNIAKLKLSLRTYIFDINHRWIF